MAGELQIGQIATEPVVDAAAAAEVQIGQVATEPIVDAATAAEIRIGQVAIEVIRVFGCSSIPAPVVQIIRRERWFPVLSQEKARLFFSMLEIDLESGTGLTAGATTDPVQGQNPILELDWSDDGGHTWSNLHFLETGPKGQYSRRAIARALGSGRDRVFRIAVSDPVQWSIIQGYMQVIAGYS